LIDVYFTPLSAAAHSHFIGPVTEDT